MNFYHGGVKANFTLDQLEIYRPGSKQNKGRDSYVGFYMYGESNLEDAFHYAEQCNRINGVKDRGVIKLVLDDNINIYEVPSFSITRITKEQMEKLISEGYDLIAGSMLGKIEYVLLNKDKIISIEFLPIEIRNSTKFDSKTIDDSDDR